MTASPLPLLGPIRQLGFVVRDLDAALATWVAMGVGPFYVLRNVAQDTSYRGEPCSVVLSVAFANSGDLQIEVIQQHGDTPSIYQEFLASGREGFNQFAFWTQDLAATLESIAWPVVWSGGGDGTGYAYVEQPGSPAAILEIMAINPGTEALANLVRTAAQGWDGSNPVRELSAASFAPPEGT